MTQQLPPRSTVVLAMSADGKIADVTQAPSRINSIADKVHLEKQIARSDAVLFGAETLPAYGTTFTVSHPELLQHRLVNGKPSQPVHIVISSFGKFNRDLRLFKQPA
ncbi:MAG: dihydrofolate reductase family protein [Cyanobacteria bacterium J06633_8]